MHQDNVDLIRGVLVAGLYPNIASIGHGRLNAFQTPNDGEVKVHPNSVVFNQKSLAPHNWLVYSKKVILLLLHTYLINNNKLI